MSGCSMGIPAVKEGGKRYYRCKMSGCVKVSSNYYYSAVGFIIIFLLFTIFLAVCQQ